MRKAGLTGEIVQSYLTRFPNAGARTISNKIYTENPTVFTDTEHVRTIVRYYLGQHGTHSRNVIANTKFVRPARDGNPYGVPESDAIPWSPVHIPERLNNGLAFSDMHFPYHDVRAVNAMIDYAVNWKINFIFINGDGLDCYQGSKFNRDPRNRSISDEIWGWIEFLNVLKDTFPSVSIYWKLGNHCERLENYLRVKAPELLDFSEFKLGEILKIRGMQGVEVIERQIVYTGRLPWVHGHELPGGAASPVSPARGLALKALTSSVVSHHHKSSAQTATDLNGKLMSWYSLGCLCYSEDTEILTQDGWKYFKDVLDTDYIGIYDQELNRTRLSRPLAKQVYRYTGDMVNFSGARIDALVTPDHKMIYYDHSGFLMNKPAQILFNGGGKYNYLSTAAYYALNSFSCNWAKLCAWIVTEGTFYQIGNSKSISIYQKKESPLQELLHLINELGLQYGLNIDKRSGVSRIKFTASSTRLIINKIWDDAYEKRIPRKILNSDYPILKVVFETLLITDGCTNKTGSSYIATIDKGLAEDYAEIVYKIGYTPVIRYQIRHTNLKPVSPIYLVTVRKTDNVFSNISSIVPYDGNVYDFTSETGWLVVRRNGHPFIASNCDLHPEYALVNQWNHGFSHIQTDGLEFDFSNMKIYQGKVYND